ncbi:MAG: acetyl-CoA carboxylase biotin carboxyl carrier protein [Magnetovibrionaceae bacterium]
MAEETKDTQDQASTGSGLGENEKSMIRDMAALMDETGLTEIEVEGNGLQIRVARGVSAIAAAAPAAAPAGAAPAAAAPDAAGSDDSDFANHPGAVLSPMVGVVYTGPDPDAPPFHKVGDSVKEGETLLLIEAMKVFNQIKAPKSGTISRILISNGTPVEFGEPLVIIE